METDGTGNAPSCCRSGSKAGIVLVLAMAIVAVVYLKDRHAATGATQAPPAQPAVAQPTAPQGTGGLPRLVDLGAGKCIPCKMMAPILEELKKEYAGRLDVTFIDISIEAGQAEKYGVNTIPTQIFFDAAGKELFRHEGYFSKDDILAKWKELGVDLGGAVAAAAPPPFARLEPAVADTRPRESVCYMCDGDVVAKTRTVLRTEKGEVVFCSPHCYFIAYSSIVEAKPRAEDVMVTDWASGALAPAAQAKYVYGADARNRPTVKAFADAAAATAEQQANGGYGIEWPALQEKELATRCGFCDRAVYPEDACAVRVEGLNTWGCCTMCALGVAARMQKDIEVQAKDALTGEPIRVQTAGGHVSVLEPESAVAWAGTRKDAEGKLVSTGCFKQAFFVNEANLMKWVEEHPSATGRMIPIEQALAEKMKLTPQQISKACKIGECTPK